MIPDPPDPRPFRAADRAALVLPLLPDDHPEQESLGHLATLILRELPEMEAELGCPVVPMAVDALPDDLPAMLVGPARMNSALERWRAARDLPDGPFVAVDRDGRRLVVDVPDLAGIGEAMQPLRTAIAGRRDLLEPSLCDTADDVLDRLDVEVRRTFPLLDERAPGWGSAVEWVRGELRDPDDLPTLQHLMATLGDAHSWAKDPRVNGRLPYHLYDDGTAARFSEVPEGTAAWEHGLRAGDVVWRPDTRSWWPRTGSVAHTKTWNVGFRALQGPVREPVDVVAIRGDGAAVRWEEKIPPLPWLEPIESGRLDARTGYLRVRGWLNGAPWQDAFEEALREMARYERLVVDLRGNIGGARWQPRTPATAS